MEIRKKFFENKRLTKFVLIKIDTQKEIGQIKSQFK